MVAANSTVANSQHRAAVGPIIVKTATEVGVVTPADRAFIHRHCSVIIVNAAATEAVIVAVAIRNGHAGDRRGNPIGHMEDTAGTVGINCEVSRTGAVNDDTLIHQQFAGGQSNGAGNSEFDRVSVECVRHRLAQRARASVGSA